MRTKKGIAAYNRLIKRRNQQIRLFVAVFFIAANLLIAAVLWPMLKKHMDDVKSGKKETLIQLKVSK